MFPLDVSRVGQVNVVLNVKENSKMQHLRFGHSHFKSLRSLKSNGIVIGLPNMSKLHHCETCDGEAGEKAIPTKKPGNAHTRLQLILTGICGLMQTSSLGGSRYYLLFVDDHNRMCRIYCLKQKSEACDTFQKFKQMVEKQYGSKIKML